MNYIGNPKHVYKDALGNPVIEGMWYKSLDSSNPEPIKVISICDTSLKYQQIGTVNSGVFKAISTSERISMALKNRICVGYNPEGSIVSPKALLSIIEGTIDLSEISHKELLDELERRLNP